MLNRRTNLTRRYLVYAVLLTVGLLVAHQTAAFAVFSNAVNDVLASISGLGVVGMFVVGVIGNASVFVQVPYSLPLLSTALGGASLARMVALGLATGIGAGVGEVISYKVADVILTRNPDLAESRLFRWVDRTVRRLPRTTSLCVFVWAVSPLPDDTVIVPLAVVGYGIRRILAPLFLGKVVHNLVVAWVFWRFSDWAVAHTSSQTKADLALVAILAFVLVLCYQVEKAKAAGRREVNATLRG